MCISTIHKYNEDKYIVNDSKMNKLYIFSIKIAAEKQCVSI